MPANNNNIVSSGGELSQFDGDEFDLENASNVGNGGGVTTGTKDVSNNTS